MPFARLAGMSTTHEPEVHETEILDRPVVEHRIERIERVTEPTTRVDAKPGATIDAALERSVSDTIAEQLGKPLRPKAVRFIGQLPKTRNGKILRRLIRGAYLGVTDLGDTSSLEDPRSLDEVRAAGTR